MLIIDFTKVNVISVPDALTSSELTCLELQLIHIPQAFHFLHEQRIYCHIFFSNPQIKFIRNMTKRVHSSEDELGCELICEHMQNQSPAKWMVSSTFHFLCEMNFATCIKQFLSAINSLFALAARIMYLF